MAVCAVGFNDAGNIGTGLNLGFGSFNLFKACRIGIGCAIGDVADWFIACTDAGFGNAWTAGDGNTIAIYSRIASSQATCSTQINVLCKFQAQGIAVVISHYTNIIISKRTSCTAFNVERTTKFAFYCCAAITVKFEWISRLNSHLIKLTAINSIGGSSRNFTRGNMFDLSLITRPTHRNL